jgi:sulfur-carrier protein
MSGEDSRPVVVRLPTVLAALFPGAERVVALSAGTVATLIDALDARWPGMGDRLRDSTPAVRRHINVFVNGKRADLAGLVPPGAEVYILTAISGG